jgi:hypothetical protein
LKKLLLIVLLGTTTVFAESFENYQLYKDPNTMRMGGVFIGVGGSGVAPFYNPAGLSTMRSKDGAEVKILNMSASINDNTVDISKDLIDLGDIEDDNEQMLEAIRLTKENIGENNHFEFSNFSYISKNISDRYGFSIGALANLNADSSSHRGFGTEGFATFDALAVGGGVLALSYTMDSKLSFGVGAKYLKYVSASENITIGKLTAHRDDFESYLIDDVVEKGESLVFDAGLLYNFRGNYRIGLSALNIGGIGAENHKTYIPQTYNFGLGYFQEFDFFLLQYAKIGFDYTDITNEYKGTDHLKNSRFGIDLTIFDKTIFTLKLGGGFYQGYPTAGLDLRVSIVDISFVTYGEEIGAYGGQHEDRRYLLNFGIGW